MIILSSGKKYYTEEEHEALKDCIASRTKDLEAIACRLQDEAVNREWCSEYNDFVDEVNELTRSDWLKKLEKEFEVTVDVTRTQEVRVTVTIEATDEQQATDKFLEWEEEDIEDYVNDNAVWYTNDVSVDVKRVDGA